MTEATTNDSRGSIPGAVILHIPAAGDEESAIRIGRNVARLYNCSLTFAERNAPAPSGAAAANIRHWSVAPGAVANLFGSGADPVGTDSDPLLHVLFRSDVTDADSGGEALHRYIAHSKSPVLLLPDLAPIALLPRHVAIAWDDSDPVHRAVAAASPLIDRAQRVTILIAERYVGDRGAVSSAERLAQSLGQRSIDARLHMIKDVESKDIGEGLMHEAKVLGADLIVMGAYWHGLWQERWLGGVSRDMIERSTIPLLLHH